MKRFDTAKRFGAFFRSTGLCLHKEDILRGVWVLAIALYMYLVFVSRLTGTEAIDERVLLKFVGRECADADELEGITGGV